MALQGLTQHCDKNLPGMITLRYAPLHYINLAAVDPLVRPGNVVTAAMQFLDDNDWLSMPLLPRGRVWEEAGNPDEQGTSYAQQLQGNLRNMRPAASGELEEMEGLRFVVWLTDRNGNNWLIGTPEAPLNFVVVASTADDGGLNAYSIRFTGATPRRAAGYEPV